MFLISLFLYEVTLVLIDLSHTLIMTLVIITFESLSTLYACKMPRIPTLANAVFFNLCLLDHTIAELTSKCNHVKFNLFLIKIYRFER